MAEKFRWANPHEWLVWKMCREWSEAAYLRRTVNELAGVLDSDQMTDLFGEEMDSDGYYDREESLPEEEKDG